MEVTNSSANYHVTHRIPEDSNLPYFGTCLVQIMFTVELWVFLLNSYYARHSHYARHSYYAIDTHTMRNTRAMLDTHTVPGTRTMPDTHTMPGTQTMPDTHTMPGTHTMPDISYTTSKSSETEALGGETQSIMNK